MYVSLCSVLPPENWSAYLPNKGNSLLTYFTYLHLFKNKIAVVFSSISQSEGAIDLVFKI